MAVFVTVCGILNFGVSFSEKFTKPEYKGLRTGMFALLIGACATTLIILNFVEDRDQLSYYSATPWLIGCGVFGMGAACYATGTPEKFFPKRFDIFGASH